MNRQSLEFTRSPGRAKLEGVETSIFQEVSHLTHTHAHTHTTPADGVAAEAEASDSKTG